MVAAFVVDRAKTLCMCCATAHYYDIRDFAALNMLCVLSTGLICLSTLESRETVQKFAHEALLRKYQLTNW